EEPLNPVALRAGMDHIATLSAKGRLLVFPRDQVRDMPRGRGVILMALDPGEKLVAFGVCTATTVTVHGSNRVGRPVSVQITGSDMDKHRLQRARKGSLLSARIKPAGLGP